MDPPYGGPIRSPGLSGPEVHGLVHPVIPSGRPCALFPAKRYCVRSYILPLRGGLVWLCQLVCPWHLSSGHVRALVGNYSPPTIVATCSPVLGILTSIAGTAVQLTGYPTYPGILCTLLK